jgi:hypothetical protein
MIFPDHPPFGLTRPCRGFLARSILVRHKIMKLKLVFTLFLLVGTIQQSFAETPVPQSFPEALVSDLYKQKNSPFFQTKDHGLVNKYFSERLAQLIWKDAVSSKGKSVRWTSTPVTTLKTLISKSSRSENPSLEKTQQK